MRSISVNIWTEWPHSGGAGDALSILTGRFPTRISAKAADTRQKVEAALKARQPVVYGMDNHNWAVLKSSSQGLTTYNPYGNTEVFTWEFVNEKGICFYISEAK